MFFRLHGRDGYHYRYTPQEIKELAQKLRSAQGEIFCLFNNTAMWENALELKEELLEEWVIGTKGRTSKSVHMAIQIKSRNWGSTCTFPLGNLRKSYHMLLHIRFWPLGWGENLLESPSAPVLQPHYTKRDMAPAGFLPVTPPKFTNWLI